MWIKSPCILNNTNASANTINIGGDFINDDTYNSTSATVNMDGSKAQQITGANRTSFYNLTINNTSSGVTLNVTGAGAKGAIVANILTLTNGTLNTTSTQLLTLNAGSSSTSGSTASYVNGPMAKIGTTAFDFPVGKGGRWARIGIGAPTASETFTAEYFNTPYSNTTSMATSPTPVLNNVSKLEYWTLGRAGSANATVKLYSENLSQAPTGSGINDCSSTDLRIAHWNGSAWENNNDAVTVTLTAGTCGTSSGKLNIITTNPVTSFSPFTFGSKSSGVNPLPVELLSFTAECSGDKVFCNWETASEQNSDYFTLEKSTDGSLFIPVAKVKAAGNSSTVKKYSAEDVDPFSASSYYRLSETDFNGATKTFDMVAVKGCGSDNISAFSNGNDITVTVNSKENSSYNICLYDAQGKIISERKEFFAAGKTSTTFPVNVSSGIYFLKIYNSQNLRNQKISIQK